MPKQIIQKTPKLLLSERILTSILLLATVLSAIYVLVYILEGETNKGIIFFSLAGCIVHAVLYYFAKFRKAYHAVSIIFIGVTLLFFSIGWFLKGGITEGAGYPFVVVISFLIIVVPIKYRYALTSFTVLNVLVLYILEYNYPEYITHQTSKNAVILSLFSNIVLCTIIVAWTLSRTKREYEKKQHIAKKQNKALINAHSAKSRFLSNVSHDLRTPMNGVVGMASLLEKTNLSTEQKEYVSTIIVSSDRLLKIINQILDYSKVETGKTELQNQAFSLTRCIKDAIQINAPHALKKRLELSYEIADDVPDGFLGDNGKLQQVLINLIGNSIKFTSKGKVHLKVHKQPSEDERTKLLFRLDDTGIGIPTSNIPHLFAPFTQVDGSRTRMHSGTGLGLAISKHLVELMGGDIWVESKLGEGSTFFFTTKMEALGDNIKIPVVSRNTIVNPLSNHKSLLKILIVEDDKINRLLAVRFFEKMGYSPDTVIDGQKALDALTKEKYDLVFMDIQMPVMDGLKATEIIRKEHQHQPIIIAMTANAMPEDKLLCEIAGMDDFLAKPVKLNVLEKMIAKWQYSS